MSRLFAAAALLAVTAGCSHAPEPASPPRPLAYGYQAPLAPPPPQAPAAAAFQSLLAALPMDIAALASLQDHIPCPPQEIAPGFSVSVTCGQIKDSALAIAHVPVHVAGAALPPEIDHRVMGLEGPIKNQQQVGACATFSMTTTMDNAIRKMGRSEVISPLHFWATYGTNPDGSIEGAPLTTEPVWPYDPSKACRLSRMGGDTCDSTYHVVRGSGVHDPFLQAERARADASGVFRVDALEKLDPRNLDEVAAVLATGDDLWSYVEFYRPAWSFSSVKAGVFPPYEGRHDVSHGVALAGYRTVGGVRQFLLHNSWGTEWAEGGYAWMTEPELAKHLVRAYKVVVAQGGSPRRPKAQACPGGFPSLGGLCVPQAPNWNTPPQGLPSIGSCAGGIAIGGVCIPAPIKP